MNRTATTWPCPAVLATVSILALASAQAATTGPDDQDAMLPELTVTGTKPLKEERPVGAYNQPAWTTQRRFATTRVYVLSPGQVEFEQWWKGKYPGDSGSPDQLFQSEIGVGLPHRLQLDFYANVQNPPEPDQDTRVIGSQVELRWALADWGRIPLNPTLYGEWKFNNSAPDAYEAKLLLGDEVATGWHWGLNAFYEQAVGGERTNESGMSTAISNTLIDEKFSLGLEMNIERASAPNFHGVPTVEVLLGPSLQWLPAQNMHVDFVPLFGMNQESPSVEAYVVFGIDFGGEGDEAIRAPTSTRSR